MKLFSANVAKNSHQTRSASQAIVPDSNQDSPEALIRKENRQVLIIQTLVKFILALAAVLTSYVIFSVTRKFQLESFKESFQVTANSLKENFLAEFHRKISASRAIAGFVEYALENGDADSILELAIEPSESWEHITNPMLAALHAHYAGWSPLLRNDEERLIFEHFAQNQTFLIGPNPICYVCGSEDRGISLETKAKTFHIPGYGQSYCEFSETITLTGVLPDGLCPFMTDIMVTNGPCVCENVLPDAVRLKNYFEKPDQIYMVSEEANVPVPYTDALYLPTWQLSTYENQAPLMFDQMTDSTLSLAINGMLKYNIPELSGIIVREGHHYEKNAGSPNEASSMLYYPIFDKNLTIIGAVNVEILWSKFMSNSLSEDIDLVIESTCGGNFTFGVNVDEKKLFLKGRADMHEETFSELAISSTFEEYGNLKTYMRVQPLDGHFNGTCQYRIHVFPAKSYIKEFVDNRPIFYAAIVLAIFVFTAIVFVLYDFLVRRRQIKVMASANRTNAIVSAMFPEVVRGRLYAQAREVAEIGDDDYGDQKSQGLLLEKNPIADTYSEATIMFLDIVGFTVWGSERDAHQVFRLLETLYGSFDRIARRLDIFKIETVGDSYVAVCGLPSPREDHAVQMARFASMCLKEMLRVVKRLESTLGPGTGDLRARVGLHSGPVTAGVLRGEKARYQIFGDTVNTAARMESYGAPHRIHASEAVANLLKEAGYESWAKPLEEKIMVKGKGSLQTYFVKPASEGGTDHTVSDVDFIEDLQIAEAQGNVELVKILKEDHLRRLVEWNTNVLYSLLEDVIAARVIQPNDDDRHKVRAAELTMWRQQDTIVIDELTQVVKMPKYRKPGSKPVLNRIVKDQLKSYVAKIAKTYDENIPFHNFAHASHVIMSADKLIKCIRQTNKVDYQRASDAILRKIHDSTYGISSDAMLHFAVVFSVLVHDAGHTGLTNAELCSIGTTTCQKYREQSVAEQNSVDVAWDLLMEREFEDLRSCIYTNEAEFRRFRQLVVNAVMATDIADKKLKKLRESRWDSAFSTTPEAASSENQDRRATITFEYIIQASDICHCMQHWLTYLKFNRRLFEERYLAYRRGHLQNNPSLGWYKGELWFFDNYVIPLAKKLDRCGVFGSSYSEFHTFALNNRSEWEQKGEEIVKEMNDFFNAKYDSVLFEKVPAIEVQGEALC